MRSHRSQGKWRSLAGRDIERPQLRRAEKTQDRPVAPRQLPALRCDPVIQADASPGWGVDTEQALVLF